MCGAQNQNGGNALIESLQPTLLTIAELKKIAHEQCQAELQYMLDHTANRIVGTVEELEAVNAAIDESGIAIETLDGTYEELPASKTLVASFLAQAELDTEAEDTISEKKEQ